MTRDRRRGVTSINHCQVSAIRPLITGCREQGRLSDESRPFSEWTYSEIRGGEKRERKRERESFGHLVEFYGLDSPLLDDDRIVDLGIERWVMMGSS